MNEVYLGTIIISTTQEKYFTIVLITWKWYVTHHKDIKTDLYAIIKPLVL